MINWSEAENIDRALPKGLDNKIVFGYIDYNMFDELGRQWLEDNYSDLKNQQVKTGWNEKGPVYEQLGFYGELSSKLGKDLGVATVLINEKEFILPKHFMSENELKKFIIKTTKKYFPELLIWKEKDNTF